MDEIACLLALPQASPGVVFIEIKRHEKPWLFNLDEHDDSKFYKSVTLATGGHQ